MDSDPGRGSKWGITITSPTPQGAAVVAVPSSDRHHDGGLAADSPYSTPNHDQPYRGGGGYSANHSPTTAAAAAGKAAAVAAVVVAVAAGPHHGGGSGWKSCCCGGYGGGCGSGVVGGGDSGWSSDEWRWCSGGAGCRKAAAVGMVTGGSGVLMVAVGGLDRSGDGEQSWGSPENFRRK
nr:hypothetical protein [Tanacetum cinerariifolium]